MVVTDITTRLSKGWAELSGLIVPEKKWRPRRRVWWRIPEAYAEHLRVSGDSFLAAFLPLCMLKNKPLKIEADVSPLLNDTVQSIQSVFMEWLPKARPISVNAGLKSAGPSGSAVGCFFSGGVDSFYSLLKNAALSPDDPDRLTHLVFVGGFDLPLKENALYRQVRTSLRGVAESSGLQLLEVRTNLRSFSDPKLTWGFYHGAALASAGLACGALFRKLLIPSSFAHEQLHPWGSHPRLDPLWATENTEFIHDGCEALRSEKITDWICRSDLALQNLRVCWKNYHHLFNCSVCEKCVRTMITLHVDTGAVDFPTFCRPLTADGIRRLELNDATRIAFARENAELMAKSPHCKTEFIDALNDAIQRGMTRMGS